MNPRTVQIAATIKKAVASLNIYSFFRVSHANESNHSLVRLFSVAYKDTVMGYFSLLARYIIELATNIRDSTGEALRSNERNAKTRFLHWFSSHLAG